MEEMQTTNPMQNPNPAAQGEEAEQEYTLEESIRDNIKEAWEIVQTAEVPEDIKKLAYRTLLTEMLERAYKDFD